MYVGPLTSFITPNKPWWWTPEFLPMGTKVYLDAKAAPVGSAVNATFPGQTQSGLLPPGGAPLPNCWTTDDACWKEAVHNGTVKFVETTAKDPTMPTRSITFALYKTVSAQAFPGKMLYCSKIFFAENGELYSLNRSVEDQCNTWELVYQTGNSLGAILAQKNPDTGVSACFQRNYNTSVKGWVDNQVTCP